MHDGKQLIHAFDALWDKYHKRLAACRADAGEEAVHKLRIGTRRLLASIELFQTLAPQRELRKLGKALKAQLDSFDELRDTQVMLLEMASAIEKLPELYPFLKQLQIREQSLSAQTPDLIRNMDDAKLHAWFKKARGHLLDALGKADLKPQILTVIDDIYRIVMERYQLIDIVQPGTIHRTRIAVKKLRYMLEASEILLSPLPENHLKQIHAYLTYMGDVQDSNVLLVKLKGFFAEQMPLSVQNHYQHRHSRIINTYMSKREDVLQFWRPSAKQAFPWKKRRLAN